MLCMEKRCVFDIGVCLSGRNLALKLLTVIWNLDERFFGGAHSRIWFRSDYLVEAFVGEVLMSWLNKIQMRKSIINFSFYFSLYSAPFLLAFAASLALDFFCFEFKNCPPPLLPSNPGRFIFVWLLPPSWSGRFDWFLWIAFSLLRPLQNNDVYGNR